jgi:hypothetical protein
VTDTAKTIPVNDETSLACVLAEADEAPVRLTKDGAIYRIVREDAAPSGAAEIVAAVDATRGTWSGIDTDALIDYIYEGREQGTRPATRP